MWDFPMILTEGGPKMERKHYNEEQVISILEEHDAGACVPDLAPPPWRGGEHDLSREVEVRRHGGQ